MLAIRLQRHGRKRYATYRFIIQESSKSPTSGRVVAQIGHYNPHTKETKLDTDKVKFYLENGARPSDRVVSLLKKEKVQLPSWVKEPTQQKRTIRNADKLRKNNKEAEQTEEASSDQEAEAKEAESSEEKPADTEDSSAEQNKEPEATAEEAADTENASEPSKEPQAQASEEKK